MRVGIGFGRVGECLGGGYRRLRRVVGRLVAALPSADVSRVAGDWGSTSLKAQDTP